MSQITIESDGICEDRIEVKETESPIKAAVKRIAEMYDIPTCDFDIKVNDHKIGSFRFLAIGDDSGVYDI